ncbi:DUF493 domain-containing protein [Halomonas sabkhae]|uniref:HP0495 family protein n=1 Tax=Halomonas sabkhae TaxID=626223 RepID=UPI0025B38E08|nr:DUF493 domain-containing protein [Halomonas sabkhae]MDN3523753.1 DUF493 domain-containing protein [Halomonas sabkhae]
MNDKTRRDLRQANQTTTQAEPPKITFPCDYPIKVVGDAVEGFVDMVRETVSRHDPSFDPQRIEVIDSRNGRFQSVRFSIRATGEEQLKALFHELKASGLVHMVV